MVCVCRCLCCGWAGVVHTGKVELNLLTWIWNNNIISHNNAGTLLCARVGVAVPKQIAATTISAAGLGPPRNKFLNYEHFQLCPDIKGACCCWCHGGGYMGAMPQCNCDFGHVHNIWINTVKIGQPWNLRAHNIQCFSTTAKLNKVIQPEVGV